MKTKSYHISNFGKYAPNVPTRDGYVTYHASTRYKSASACQLEAWSKSRLQAVRNAAMTEMAERALIQWRMKI